MITKQQINNYSEILILAAKEQGFNTAKEINDNFEALMLYILSLESSFLKKMLLKANDKQIMDLLALRAYKKLKIK